eukprot:CAMPEP_0182597848 /NCGR_PEP_ID=MMETSP1324-20130603/87101_1 /TAXON_ID=236786 /ORGANISM="Florenciella sp., Strain RCC1587" /LENGTH=45 /DNA_ID= /DNA_START= /DNA_END= /DNA_ORIENTATION=
MTVTESRRGSTTTPAHMPSHTPPRGMQTPGVVANGSDGAAGAAGA